MYSNNSRYSTSSQSNRSSYSEPQRRSITAILGPSNRVFSSRNKASICVPQTRGLDMFNSSSARPTFSSTSPLTSQNFSSTMPLAESNFSSSSSPFIQLSSSNDLYDIGDSRRDSSLRLETKKKIDFSLSKTRFSAHGHTINEIDDILEKIINTDYDFTISSFNSKNESTAEKDAENVETIAAFLNQPGVFQTLDSKTIEKLLLVVRKNILRKVSDIPKPLLYGDFYAPISVTNWNILFFFHKLVSIIVNSLDDQIVDQWIDKSFIIGLVDLLNSSDSNEQTSTVILIQQIFETFDTKKQFLFNRLIKLVMLHNEGVNSFVCVPPALKFFTYYFSQNKGYFNQSYNNFFKLVIFQLFATDFVHNYYNILSSLCQIFYQSDSSLALWALKFLLNHWPISNSAKHTIYLHHIRILSNSIPSNSSDPAVFRLFEQIGQSLFSQNFKVANAALQLVGNVNFLFNFTPIFPTIIPILIKSLQNLESHWHPEVRELTKNVYQVVLPLAANLNNNQNTGGKNYNSFCRRERRINQVLSDNSGSTLVSSQNSSSPNSLLTKNIKSSGSANRLPSLKDINNEDEDCEDKAKTTRGNWMSIYQTAITIDTGLMTDLIPEKIMLIE